MKMIITQFSVAFLMFNAVQILGAQRNIELPEETSILKQSSHPGHQLALQRCSICHSVDYINLQPPEMSLRQWIAEVGKMKSAYGASINDDEIKLIGEYLFLTYGLKLENKSEASEIGSPK